jgi:hypothetical protein
MKNKYTIKLKTIINIYSKKIIYYEELIKFSLII